MKQAKEKMAVQDTVGKGHYLGKALDIIAELNASLNFQEGREVAANLFHLYNFMTMHLTKANINWDAGAVDEVIALLAKLKEAWEEVCHKGRTGAMEEGTGGERRTPRQHMGSLVV